MKTSGMPRRLVLAGALRLGALSLGGCGLASGLSERPYTERRDWPLLAVRPVTLPAPRRGHTLLLRTLRAGPAAQARGLQTLQPDGSVRTAFYEEWAAPPSEGVEQSLRGWLEASGLFTAVLSPGSRAEADFVLDAELEALAADPPAQVAQAALSFVLVTQHAFAERVLLQAALQARERLAGDDAPAQVRAMTAAVASLCAQMEARLERFA